MNLNSKRINEPKLKTNKRKRNVNDLNVNVYFFNVYELKYKFRFRIKTNMQGNWNKIRCVNDLLEKKIRNSRKTLWLVERINVIHSNEFNYPEIIL